MHRGGKCPTEWGNQSPRFQVRGLPWLPWYKFEALSQASEMRRWRRWWESSLTFQLLHLDYIDGDLLFLHPDYSVSIQGIQEPQALKFSRRTCFFKFKFQLNAPLSVYVYVLIFFMKNNRQKYRECYVVNCNKLAPYGPAMSKKKFQLKTYPKFLHNWN